MRKLQDSSLEKTLTHMELSYQELVNRVREIQAKQNIDPLTALPRRDLFENESRDIFAFIIIDLDHFKSINDRFGHPIGDAVLKNVGVLLKALGKLHSRLSICRLGGEEFAIWLADPVSPEVVLNLAEQIRASIETLVIPTNHMTFGVTASLGVVTSDSTICGSDIRSLYARADQALYAAKQNGRNVTKLAA